MTDMSTTASELDQEIASPTGAGSTGKTFFSLSQTEPNATIRFLSYPSSGNSVMVHYHYDNDRSKGVQMPCLKQFGNECPYCSLGQEELTKRGIDNRKMFLFPIYWQEQGCQALFAYSILGWSPLPAIHQAVTMRRKRGIEPDEYDFSLKRVVQPGKRAAKTSVFHCDPSPMPPAAANIMPWTVEETRDKYLSAMVAFDKKRHENAAPSPDTNLDTDLSDIVL